MNPLGPVELLPSSVTSSRGETVCVGPASATSCADWLSLPQPVRHAATTQHAGRGPQRRIHLSNVVSSSLEGGVYSVHPGLSRIQAVDSRRSACVGLPFFLGSSGHGGTKGCGNQHYGAARAQITPEHAAVRPPRAARTAPQRGRARALRADLTSASGQRAAAKPSAAARAAGEARRESAAKPERSNRRGREDYGWGRAGRM